MTAKPKPCNCVDCDKPITANTKTGRCIPCANRFIGATEAFQQARAEGIRRKFRDDPAHIAKMRRVAAANGKRAMLDPARVEQLREHGRKMRATHLSTPAALAARLAVAKDVGRKITETRLGWCPPEYRAEYRRLTLSKRFLAADAKAMILATIKATRARMSPFERQMYALEQQARRAA